MRIIAGKLRHRSLQMTNLDTTRETQDKVRGAIFNMIGPYFDGGTVLDLFAGSGAMGIEAYSRGIETIYLNDLEPQAIAVCKKNCSNLGIEVVHFSTLDYRICLKQLPVLMDYVFLDPPYKMNQIEELLSFVEPVVKPGGYVVFEMSKDSSYPEELQSLCLQKDRCYGIKRVAIYQKK